jgi:hypothetical protein
MRRWLAFLVCPVLRDEVAALQSGNTKVALENGRLLDGRYPDVMRDTIARAVYRYQEGPGTFDQPGSVKGDLIKNISIDEAENIRRAIMGEPELPLESDSSDVVF